MRKTRSFSLLATALVAIPSLCFAINKSNNADIIRRNYDIFTSVVNFVEANYVDSLPLEKMFEEAISGFLDPLDPYTDFFNEKDAKEFFQNTKGEYAGIGTFLQQKGDYIVITQPQEGSPALQGGLKTGDIIIRVDTTDAKGMSVDQLREHVMGIPGTTVNLRVNRPFVGADSILDFTLTRAMLNNPTVSYYGVDKDGIGYISLDKFGDNSIEEMSDALQNILKDKNLKGIVIDVAGNPGGTLESVVGILELIVPKGTTVLTVKSAQREKKYTTTKQPLVPKDMPLAIIIDGSSASAAEVLAGTLQDLDRAVLVGSRSYGKGLVQSTMPTPYNTMVKITTAKYYIPSGRLIQAYDYSRRNADGSVAHVPDSLARAFKTKAGRTVYDGGGLTPDSVPQKNEYKPIAFALYDQDKFFDYANKYAASHKEISSPRDFRITDEIYADFVEFVDPKTFRYSTDGEKMVKKLRKYLKDEGLIDEEVDKRLTALEESLTRDVEKDLQDSRSYIEMLLTPEIVSRYYGNAGYEESLLNFNKTYEQAKRILLDKALYKKILSAPVASTSDKKK